MRTRKEMIDLLYRDYEENADRNQKEEGDRIRALNTMSDLIEGLTEEEEYKLTPAMLDLYNAARLSAFHAGFEAAKQLLR